VKTTSYEASQHPLFYSFLYLTF